MHSHAGAWERGKSKRQRSVCSTLDYRTWMEMNLTVHADFCCFSNHNLLVPILLLVPIRLLVPTLLRGNPIRYAFPRGSMGTRNFRYFPNHNSNLCFNSRACRRDTSTFVPSFNTSNKPSLIQGSMRTT